VNIEFQNCLGCKVIGATVHGSIFVTLQFATGGNHPLRLQAFDKGFPCTNPGSSYKSRGRSSQVHQFIYFLN